MNEKTKEQMTIQTIRAMRNALDQPGTDVDEHASLHLISAGPGRGSTMGTTCPWR